VEAHKWRVAARLVPGVKGARVSEVEWCTRCGAIRERHDDYQEYWFPTAVNTTGRPDECVE